VFSFPENYGGELWRFGMAPVKEVSGTYRPGCFRECSLEQFNRYIIIHIDTNILSKTPARFGS